MCPLTSFFLNDHSTLSCYNTEVLYYVCIYVSAKVLPIQKKQPQLITQLFKSFTEVNKINQICKREMRIYSHYGHTQLHCKD